MEAIISCQHPKYSTTLYVAGVARKFITFTGNKTKALVMPSNIAKNVRDDVLEEKIKVALHWV